MKVCVNLVLVEGVTDTNTGASRLIAAVCELLPTFAVTVVV